jgi:hypothetical protein
MLDWRPPELNLWTLASLDYQHYGATTMLDKTTELGKFIGWLREQHGDKTYDWSDGEHCLMAQYLEATGQQETEFSMIRDWSWYMDVTLPRPHTFGAALQRAKKFA